MMRDSSALMDYGANVTLEGGYSTGLASMQLYNRIVTLTQGYRVPANFIGQIVIEFIATTGSAQISAFGTINVSSPTPTFNTYDSVAIGNYKNTAVGCFFSSVTGKVYSQALAASNQNRIDMGFFIGIHTLATLAAPADASFGTGPNQIDYGTENWNILHRTNFKSVYAPDFTAIKSGYDIETAYGYGSWLNPDTQATFLEKNSTLGFMTDAGKIGLIKIVGFSPDANSSGTGTLMMNVLVEK